MNRLNFSHPSLFFLILSILLRCANSSDENKKSPQQETVVPQKLSSEKRGIIKKIDSLEAKIVIAKRAKEVIIALKSKDTARLSSLIHPDKGVRFSPYAFVDVKRDIVLKAEHIKTIFADTTKHLWGFYDGTDEEMKLSFADYFKQFIYNRDFATAKQIGYQRIIGRGNTINNNFEVYPGAIIVEYHFPGFDPIYDGIDWESLRLVFEEKDGGWYLVGVIHDQWTI